MDEWFRLAASDHRETPPQDSTNQAAAFRVTVNAIFTPGTTLTLNVGAGSSGEITFGDYDMGPLFEVGTGNWSSDTLTGSAENLLQVLRRNPFIGSNYYITRTSQHLDFVALSIGASWMYQSKSGTADVTVTPQLPSADEVYAANYGICVRPWIKDRNNNWVTAGEFCGTPDKDHLFGLDISQSLRPYLFPDWPGFVGTGAAYRCVLSVRPFYLQYYVRKGNPAEQQGIYHWGDRENPKQAWLAGGTDRDRVAFNSFVNRATGVTGTPPHHFLTWRNRRAERYVTRSERHYLGWYHWPMQATPSTLAVQAKLWLTNGDTVDWTDRYTFSTLTSEANNAISRTDIGHLAVGYGQLNLAAIVPSGTTVERYAVRVNETETGPKSEEITFWVAQQGWNDRYLWYVNSLGCVESLRTQGAWVLSTQHEYLELQRSATASDVGVVAESLGASEPLGGQQKLTVFTGYHPQAEHSAILDILNAPRDGIKLCDYSGNRLLPLRLVESEEVKIQERGSAEEHLYGLKLTFLLDDPEVVVTQTPTNAETVQNEDDGFTSIPGDGGDS